MTYPKLSLLFLAFSLLILTGCDKDDDSSAGKTTSDGFMIGAISGDKGSSLTITTNGKSETCTGSYVFGWHHMQLLNGNYTRLIRSGCNSNGYAFRFRVSVPADIQFQDIIEGKHELKPVRLLLEHSANLDAVYPELYLESTNPPASGNATGTVEIRRDVVALDETYSLVGNLDVTFYEEGEHINLKGIFWEKYLEW